jgi:DNA-binding NarL/FixJ family response regulator
MIRLVLADDHRIILEGLEQLFRRERDFDVIATCTTGEETIEATRRFKPDVLVLDLRMPQGDGLSVMRTLRAEGLPTRVVLLTASMEDDEVVEAVQLGVCGLVLKEAAAVKLVHCVRGVNAGERSLEPALINRALDRVLKKQEAVRLTESLSPRETEIVKMVAVGMRNKEIASRLAIGEGTVKSHLHAIYEKLGVHGRVELTMYAYERGMV